MQDKRQITGPTFKAVGDRPTTVGFILAHIANGRYVLGWEFHKRISYPYSNIASLIEQYAQANGYTLDYPPLGWMTESSFTGKSHDPEASVKHWQLDFDLLLHDAATWYTETLKQHTWLTTDKAVQTATFLWRMSRQLRSHAASVAGQEESSKKNSELDRLWKQNNKLRAELKKQREYRHEERIQRDEAEKEVARLSSIIHDLG